MITTGVPRANGQVERINRSIISILTKLSLQNPAEWFKHVNRVQQAINSSYSRSIGMTPFELLIGRNMRLKDDLKLRELLKEATIETFHQERSRLRRKAKENILKIQEENRKTYNRKRKKSFKYRVGDVVAIQRTQLGPGLKVRPKFLGPYRINTELRNDRYIVEKLGECEGPNRTSTSVDHMKLWPKHRGVDLDPGGLTDDDTENPSQVSAGIGADTARRMAECGNERFSAIGSTGVEQRADRAVTNESLL